jgi:hypothetical protein
VVSAGPDLAAVDQAGRRAERVAVVRTKMATVARISGSLGETLYRRPLAAVARAVASRMPVRVPIVT